jgi:hypothetical protein
VKGDVVLDQIQIALQALLGTGLLYGGFLAFSNWHLSGSDSSEQNHG